MPLLLLKDLPRYECLLEAAREFPDLDPSATEVFLNLLRTGDEAFRVAEAHLAEQREELVGLGRAAGGAVGVGRDRIPVQGPPRAGEIAAATTIEVDDRLPTPLRRRRARGDLPRDRVAPRHAPLHAFRALARRTARAAAARRACGAVGRSDATLALHEAEHACVARA